MSGYLSTFSSESETSEIAAALVQNGGAIISELMPCETMDVIRSEIENSVSAEEQKGSSELWPEGDNTVGGLAAVSPTFVEKLLIQPKVLEIVDAVLNPMKPMSQRESAEEESTPMSFAPLDDGGTQLVWKNEKSSRFCHHYTVGACVMLEIGAGRKDHQFLHRENAIYQPFVSHLDMREFIVSTMWAGTDFVEENGATRVVPGSQRWPEERLAKPEEIKQAVMKKGSVVLWLSRTLHGAAKSSANENRTGFFSSYVADWVRQEENQYIAVPQEVARNYSRQARQIIGYRSSPTLGWAKGRDAGDLLEPGHSGQI